MMRMKNRKMVMSRLNRRAIAHLKVKTKKARVQANMGHGAFR